MRSVSFVLAILLSFSLLFFVSCKKEMSLKDYIKIENEILETDLKPESKKVIAEKYGFTLEQFEKMSEKIEKDPSLKEKLGEIRLGEQKEEK